MGRRRILILGAAGRDFHNFNVVFRDSPDHEVVGFTATQIPKIDERRYPAALCGSSYPEGIPIYPESQLEQLIADLRVDDVVFAYSDVDYQHIGHVSARALAAGANFRILGTRDTMLESSTPIVAITAVRTGCGKSQTTRFVANVLRGAGMSVSAVRHPMPYGDLAKQAVQRFATVEDLIHHNCTFEEREEYETHIRHGIVVHAGVDYAAILEAASSESDVVIWDGGNNDWSFFKPNLSITVADPLRPGHESRYFPGEVNFRSADVILINKARYADKQGVEAVVRAAAELNPTATVIRAGSTVKVDNPDAVRGKRVLCIEDGPTLTHGEMTFGAAQVAAEQLGVAEVVDPRPNAVRSIRATLNKYPHIGRLLPAMGYFPEQIKDLEDSINATDCDAVLIGTPFDLAAQLKINKPAVRVTYELDPIEGEPSLKDLVLAAVGK